MTRDLDRIEITEVSPVSLRIPNPSGGGTPAMPGPQTDHRLLTDMPPEWNAASGCSIAKIAAHELDARGVGFNTRRVNKAALSCSEFMLQFEDAIPTKQQFLALFDSSSDAGNGSRLSDEEATVVDVATAIVRTQELFSRNLTGPIWVAVDDQPAVMDHVSRPIIVYIGQPPAGWDADRFHDEVLNAVGAGCEASRVPTRIAVVTPHSQELRGDDVSGNLKSHYMSHAIANADMIVAHSGHLSREESAYVATQLRIMNGRGTRGGIPRPSTLVRGPNTEPALSAAFAIRDSVVESGTETEFLDMVAFAVTVNWSAINRHSIYRRNLEFSGRWLARKWRG